MSDFANDIGLSDDERARLDAAYRRLAKAGGGPTAGAAPVSRAVTREHEPAPPPAQTGAAEPAAIDGTGPVPAAVPAPSRRAAA